MLILGLQIEQQMLNSHAFDKTLLSNHQSGNWQYSKQTRNFVSFKRHVSYNFLLNVNVSLLFFRRLVVVTCG